MPPNTIDEELILLEQANLDHVMAEYLFEHFKNDFNQRILKNLIQELDRLVESLDASNSFRILSISEQRNQRTDAANTSNSLSSSMCDQMFAHASSKSLLNELAAHLMALFQEYNKNLFEHLTRFEHYSTRDKNAKTANSKFATKSELLIYQRSILIDKLSSTHYKLFNILFKNVFDTYQQMENNSDENENDNDRDETNENLFGKNPLIEKFHGINKILFDLRLFDHLCGDVVVEVVENKICQHIENTSLDNYEESFIEAFEIWLDKIIIGWIKLIYTSSVEFTNEDDLLLDTMPKTESNCTKFEEYLLNYKKQLSHFMYTHYTHTRIKRLFDIVIDFPDSKNAIDDLKICLSKTNQRANVIKSLRSSIEQRLLHPGVNTSDILTAYVSAIKALLCLDPTGVIMENICEPLKKYLRNREDTVKCIVSNLTDDPDSSNDLMEEFCKDLYSYEGNYDMIDSNTAAPLNPSSSSGAQTSAAGPSAAQSNPSETNKLKAWQLWMPDPIDAANLADDLASGQGSKSNIISMLVNIYGSKDLFVNEYKTLLADRLLSNYSYNMEKEIRNLELLKLRFGESNLFACEAMIKDISESKRINANILEQLKKKGCDRIGSFEIAGASNLKCLILSEQFWPKLKEEKIEMPEELSQIQEKFMSSYEAFKGNRTLIWKNNLGQVSLEIEVNKQKLEFTVTPIQAAIILKFQEKDTWSLQELSQSLKMCSFALRKKLIYWKMQGLIKELENNPNDKSMKQSAQTAANTSDQPSTSNANETATVAVTALTGGDSNSKNEIYTLVKETNKLNKNSKLLAELEQEEDEEGGGSTGAKTSTNRKCEILKEQELTLYWNYTQSMLRSCGCLPLDRIHAWLKLYANPDLTVEQVKYLVEFKTKEQLLKYNGGLYRLNK